MRELVDGTVFAAGDAAGTLLGVRMLRDRRLRLLALGMAALVGGERVLAERLGQSWVNDLRVTVFERVARTPVHEHRYSTGATAMRSIDQLTQTT